MPTGGAREGLSGRIQAFLRGRSADPDAIKIRDITPDLVEEAASATEGFSGRELAKLVASMQVVPPGMTPYACSRTLTNVSPF